MAYRTDTLARMQQRVAELIQSFERYATIFDHAELFTGPSLFFHFKTIEIRRRHASANQTLQDDAFFESLYATLTAWGLHRMGATGAKLVDFTVFSASLRQAADQIQSIEALHLWEIKDDDLPQITTQLWNIISALQVGIGKTKIVSGSKALHHLLPELVPPIDRQYTLRFFFDHTSLNQGDERAFRAMYPHFYQIAKSRQREIQSWLGKGMNTSATKVIDNAIVGYVRDHLI